MKSLYVVIMLLVGIIIYGQQDKFIFNSSYGLAYLDFSGKIYALPPDAENNIVAEINPIGTAMGFEIDYKIKNNNYLGIGFTRQHHSKKVNNTFTFGNDNFILDNYRFNLNKTLIDLRFKKVYSHFSWSAGLFYFWDSFSSPSILTNNNYGIDIVLDGNYNNADQFGLYAGLGYYYPIKDYVGIGLQSKIYYSFAGLETVTLAPYIAFNF